MNGEWFVDYQEILTTEMNTLFFLSKQLSQWLKFPQHFINGLYLLDQYICFLFIWQNIGNSDIREGGGTDLLIVRNLDNNLTHRLIAFEVLVSVNDIFPVENFINKDLECTIMLGKVIQNSMLIDFITQTSLIFQRTSTKVGTFNLILMQNVSNH